jgi:hypothetical protein
MYTLISYSSGIVIEGVIVSSTRNRMRVVAAEMGDALKLRRSGKGWITDTGESVELEFVAAGSGSVSAPTKRVCTAGAGIVI